MPDASLELLVRVIVIVDVVVADALIVGALGPVVSTARVLRETNNGMERWAGEVPALQLRRQRVVNKRTIDFELSQASRRCIHR